MAAFQMNPKECRHAQRPNIDIASTADLRAGILASARRWRPCSTVKTAAAGMYTVGLARSGSPPTAAGSRSTKIGRPLSQG